MAAVSSGLPVLKDSEGLIVPRKLANPCLESRSVQDLHRQIRWNNKAGINVLDTKSELEKALARQRLALTTQQKLKEADRTETEEPGTAFKKVLAERAKRLEKIETETESPLSEEEDNENKCSPKEVFLRLEGKVDRPGEKVDTKADTKGEKEERGEPVIKQKEREERRPSNKAKSKVLDGGKLLDESSTEQESEFARVFAQLRGQGRLVD